MLNILLATYMTIGFFDNVAGYLAAGEREIGRGTSLPITRIFSPVPSTICRMIFVQAGLTLLTMITPSRFFSFELLSNGIFPQAETKVSVSSLRDSPGMDLMNCSLSFR